MLLPLPLAGALDYRMPDGATAPEPGRFVQVSLGPRRLIGVIWGRADDDIAEERMRPIIEVLPTPPLPGELRRFIDRVAAYTLAPPGMVLRMAMSSEAALLPPTPRRICVITDAGRTALAEGSVSRLTPARRRVLDMLCDQPAETIAETARRAGVGGGVVRGLIAAGLAGEHLAAPVPPPVETPDWCAAGPFLSPAQAHAAQHLVERVETGRFRVTVLDGVTGSGKTEAYFAAIAAALARGKQVLVLLPEIALSAQWLDRFAARFGAAPHPWHSDLTASRRRQVWREVAGGRARVVVGARSALFLPFPDLGLVVVDEEHDASYKQDEGVCYQARDMAVVRAHLGAIPIVLASATPSLETQANVQAGRYRQLHLPARHGGATLPEIGVVDLRKTPPARRTWLAPPLAEAVAKTLDAGEQALLFLNRRGYAPLTLCRACGHRLQCPNCSAWLVEHRQAGRLQCHHCGLLSVLPSACPICGAKDQMAPCGPGVERVAEEAGQRFPRARIAIMASDTLPGPEAAQRLVAQMERHEVDLLVGTQVVAKGHHFPMLTLVGVVDADLGLAGGDLRAAERTFQLLTQVAGRAGRADRPGKVLLQTFQPEHPVIAALASGDAARFFSAETEARRNAGMPPFGRLAAVIVSGPDAARVDETAHRLGRSAPQGEGIETLGPAPAPLAFLRGKHRRRFLVKASRRIALQEPLRRWLAQIKPASGVRIQVDVDPYSFV